MWLLAAGLCFVQTAFSSGVDLNNPPMSHEIAQQKKVTEVSGVVTDAMGPVIGATVTVKGTSTGVITDLEGRFILKLPVGSTIVVSYIGYANKEIVYKGEKNLKISLDENVQELQEVQVIAYGAQKKVTITGALSSIGNDELLKSPVASMANALTGKVTGLASVQGSGQPGADDATLYVRGVGSLSADLSRPLMLVDGVERSFFQLDPNEVESITVLKDASATAVFGVRGANGVILVTTRRGVSGKTRVNFTTTYAWQMPSRVPEFAGSYEYAEAYVKAQRHDGVAEGQLAFKDDVIEKFRTNSDPIRYPNTDWTDMLIKNAALQTQHNFNISGGSERVKYFASLGAFTQDGLFKTFGENGNDKGFKYNRYNYRVNMDIEVTKSTSMQINLGGYLNDKQEPNYNNGTYTSLEFLFRDVYSTLPFSGAGVVDGKWVSTDTKQFALGNFTDGLNIYYGKGYNNLTQNMLNFDFQLDQKLDMVTKGLRAHVKGAYNSGVTVTKRREGRANRYEAILNADGQQVLKKIGDYEKLGYSETPGLSRNWYLEAALNYKRDFGHHHVSGLAMYNQSMTYYLDGNDGPAEFAAIPRAYVGLVGRATYDYKTRYMVDLSVGYNGSENFAEGQRFGLFPAGSLGWILSEEEFFKPLKKVVSYFKFRGSFGIVGNDRVSDKSRFLYLPDKYLISSGSYNFGTNTSTNIVGAAESKKGNPNVTWETAEKQNYGIDAKFFADRLSVNFDYFIEHRKNILKSRVVNPDYLAVSLPTANIGKVDNQGYEINLKWDDNIGKVRYNIGANLSYAKNTIVFIDEIKYPYEWMQTEGKPVGQEFGYVFDGYFTEAEAANYSELKGKENGIADQGSGYQPLAGDVKYKDLNGDHKIDEKDVRDIGNPKYPLYTAGINMGLSWKGFDFSMTWSGAFKTSRLLEEAYRVPFGAKNDAAIMTYMIEEAWTPEMGDAAKAPALSLRSKSHNYQDSDLWLRDASYLRLKNIELGYSFPAPLMKKIHVGSLRVFASGYNLLTFDKLKVSDPEGNTAGRSYPIIKVVNVGLKVGF